MGPSTRVLFRVQFDVRFDAQFEWKQNSHPILLPITIGTVCQHISVKIG
jgi:hypothetical protein